MSRIWQEFKGLLPDTSIVVGQVTAHNADGTSTVEFPNGSELKVRGQGVSVGGYAFIKDGEIRGDAPARAPITLEV